LAVVVILLGVVIALAAAWVALAVVLYTTARRHRLPASSAAGVIPGTLRLLRDLTMDRSLPRGVRWRLGAALLYCAQPINLIPDFIPVIGFADNIVVACWALRSVIRRAGPEAVRARWHGTPEALELLCRALRLPVEAK
jgi:uncharacterized membrane protein YkvA (DUF1232 family)